MWNGSAPGKDHSGCWRLVECEAERRTTKAPDSCLERWHFSLWDWWWWIYRMYCRSLSQWPNRSLWPWGVWVTLFREHLAHCPTGLSRTGGLWGTHRVGHGVDRPRITPGSHVATWCDAGEEDFGRRCYSHDTTGHGILALALASANTTDTVEQKCVFCMGHWHYEMYFSGIMLAHQWLCRSGTGVVVWSMFECVTFILLSQKVPNDLGDILGNHVPWVLSVLIHNECNCHSEFPFVCNFSAPPKTHVHVWCTDLHKNTIEKLSSASIGRNPWGIESVSGSMIKRIWQEGFPDFALESQLLQILRDFCNCKAEPEVIDLEEQPPAIVDLVSDAPDLDHRKEYETKKRRLIRTALGGLSSDGFLICLAHYLQLRVPTVHEFCAICDQPFNLPPMMMRTVCSNELCAYQFGEFGSKITTAESVNHPSEILDLLMCMLFAAGTSTRRTDVLDPYPLVQVGQSEGGCILHPQRKDFNKVESLVQELQILRSKLGEKMGASWALCTSQMSVEAAALLKWTAASNRSYLAPLEDPKLLWFVRRFVTYQVILEMEQMDLRYEDVACMYAQCIWYHISIFCCM